MLHFPFWPYTDTIIIKEIRSVHCHAPWKEFLRALGGYCQAVTGLLPPEESFRLTRQGDLSLSAYVRLDAPAAAAALTEGRARCLWMGTPLLERVQAEKGWLIFTFTDGFFRQLLTLGESLPSPPPEESHLYNRLWLLAQKGPAPCPREPRVRRALISAFYAWGTGRREKELPCRLRSMTHIAPDAARLELEAECGSAARALLGFLYIPVTHSSL